MKPLFVLIIVYVALLAFGGHTNFDKGNIFAGNIAMGIMLLFTAIGHFKFKTSMAAMIPLFIPKKVEIIILTGVLEIVFCNWIKYRKYSLLYWNYINNFPRYNFTCKYLCGKTQN